MLKRYLTRQGGCVLPEWTRVAGNQKHLAEIRHGWWRPGIFDLREPGAL
jgi:hypothetical protein